MKKLQKIIYLILGLVTPILFGSESWLHKKIQNVSLPGEEKLSQIPPYLRESYLLRKEKMLSRLLARYTQEKIDWQEKSFWEDQTLQKKLQKDLLYALEVSARSARIIHDKLPKENPYFYLYDIIARKKVPYLRSIPRSIEGIKTLLPMLWEHAQVDPSAQVRYYDADKQQWIQQTPCSFIASPKFETLALKTSLRSQLSGSNGAPSLEKLDNFKYELLQLYLDHSSIPKSSERKLIEKEPIFIALKSKLVDPIAQEITTYLENPALNVIDAHGHRVLDYVQKDKFPRTYQLLQQCGARHHKPFQAPQPKKRPSEELFLRATPWINSFKTVFLTPDFKDPHNIWFQIAFTAIVTCISKKFD